LLSLADTLSQAVESGGKRVAVKGLNQPNPLPEEQVEDLSTADKVALLEHANQAARALDKRIVQVKVVYGDFHQQLKIANSLGLFCRDERWGFVFMVQVVAAEGNLIQTGYEVCGGSSGFPMVDEATAAELAAQAGRRALMMLEARPAPAGKMTVVLSGQAGGTMVHEAIGHGLEADLAQNGLSVYSKRLGEQVASPLITVVDDATMPGRRGSYRYDDEGVEGQKTLLVEKGILRGYLYDRLSAMKDGVSSTGNGRRQSYRHQPIPRMSNTLITPGESDPAEIIRSVKKGLLVTRLGGGQVNTVNGDFVFEVSEGYLIENGEAALPLRGANLIGNGPRVLQEVEAVGNDLGFTIGTCGKDGQGAPVSDGQPTLLLPQIVVGGTGG
jgi:TldD protein